MSRIASLVALVTLAGLASAQATFTLPAPPSVTVNNVPLAVGQCRYQQYFSANDWLTNQATPGRVDRLRLFPGAGATTTTTLELEVRMAHGPQFGITGLFDNNLVSDTTTVFPRQTVTLTAGSDLILNFSNLFTWNGTGSVMVEFKVYDNGQGGQPFQHDNVSTTTASTNAIRAFAVGDPNATFATSVQTGWGLLMEFNTILGADTEYGQGCPGAGGFVPEAVVIGPASRPGIGWVHQVQRVSNGRLCFWVSGTDNQNSSQGPLPLDLGQFGISGCSLLNSADLATFAAVSAGGGFGSSIGEVTISLPPISTIIGLNVFSQWFVFDRGSPNGRVATSQGIWSIIGQ